METTKFKASPFSALRAARLAAGLSQEALGVKAGLSGSTIWLCEKAPHLVSPRTAEACAAVLGVPAEQLMQS